MKPAWDKLIQKYEGHASALVADVDCTAAGKELCETVGVQGYPTIKWGSPDSLEDYEGGRDYDELEKFAEENLKPMCSPSNLDLCDEDKKKEIQKLMDMAPDKLDEEIQAKEKLNKDAEEEFEAEVKKLQEKYEALEKEKNEKLAAVKASGLGLAKAVKASKDKKKEEL